VAGGQDYEVGYEAKKTKRSRAAVKKAVKKVGSEVASTGGLFRSGKFGTGNVLLLENARIGITQAFRGIVEGGCLD
jgi:hypothetical protein